MDTELKDVSCLFSTVQNKSGRDMFFGFLGAHGRRLMADETYTMFGDVLSNISYGQRGGRAEATRDITAFNAAIARGDLEIIQTVSPVLYSGNAIVDESHPAFPPDGTGTSEMLSNAGGTFALVAPCWFTEEEEPEEVVEEETLP